MRAEGAMCDNWGQQMQLQLRGACWLLTRSYADLSIAVITSVAVSEACTDRQTDRMRQCRAIIWVTAHRVMSDKTTSILNHGPVAQCDGVIGAVDGSSTGGDYLRPFEQGALLLRAGDH